MARQNGLTVITAYQPPLPVSFSLCVHIYILCVYDVCTLRSVCGGPAPRHLLEAVSSVSAAHILLASWYVGNSVFFFLSPQKFWDYRSAPSHLTFFSRRFQGWNAGWHGKGFDLSSHFPSPQTSFLNRVFGCCVMATEMDC